MNETSDWKQQELNRQSDIRRAAMDNPIATMLISFFGTFLVLNTVFGWMNGYIFMAALITTFIVWVWSDKSMILRKAEERMYHNHALEQSDVCVKNATKSAPDNTEHNEDTNTRHNKPTAQEYELDDYERCAVSMEMRK